MDDLGKGLAGQNVLMLGGGNPAHIPEVQRRFRERMQAILEENGAFERLIGNYDTPQGNGAFLEALAGLLGKEFGWKIGPENIALTLGSQTGFFLLFNMFAGEFAGGKTKKILLPLTPEYIGYADVGLTDEFFVSRRPEIELIADHLFKYHVDFDALDVTDDVGAICVSRPTNPTGNVVTDAEIEKLGAIAKARGIPLMVDNAYGAPFPDIIFTDATLTWDDHIILCMSLSKLGLPGARTGIVIAKAETIKALSDMVGVMSLAPSGIGAGLACEMIRTGEILALSRDVIRPHYEEKAKRAVSLLTRLLGDLDFRIHLPEGAFFLWLWLPNLPITSQELYERLKVRGVVVVPGQHFFPGLEDEWAHRNECLRIGVSQGEETVTQGLDIIADEVKRVFAGEAAGAVR
jgi:valine--pyruvate aminotransferase